MIDHQKELEEFAYVVSHDLNAPLRHVREFGKLLMGSLEDKITDDEKEYFHYMQTSVFKAEDMLEALLQYSRLNTQSGPFENTDWNDLLQKLVNDELEKKIASSNADITAQSLPTSLAADQHQAKTLLYQLIDNAIRFTPDTRSPRVIITAQENTEEIVFSLMDNGIGIPPEQFENIFIMFKQVDPYSPASGTGAGLALCKKITTRHGGHIWIETSSEAGTKINFTIAKNLE